MDHSRNIKGSRSFGTARTDRAGKALNPSFAPIDDRSTADLLALAVRFAELIQYYNENDEPIGDWTPFLTHDVSAFLAQVMTQDVKSLVENVRKYLRATRQNKTIAEKKNTLTQALDELVKMFTLLNDWYVSSRSAMLNEMDNPLQRIISRAVEGELGAQLKLFRRIVSICRADDSIQLDYELGKKMTTLTKDWPKGEDKTLLFLEKTPAEKIDLVVTKLNQIFERFHLTFSYLKIQAEQFFKKSLSDNDHHQPDVGLLLSFLDLFGHAQAHLNTITQRHLNHYYFHVLKQKPKAPTLDHTIVCFELAKHVSSYLLKGGTPLLAGTNEAGLESHYATLQSLVITQTKIEQLKTIFVSRNPLVGVGSSYRLVSNIYQSTVANSGDGKGGEFLGNDKTWPIFGEEQLDKSTDEKRMEAAAIGFALSSPVLRLEEGIREINIHFKMTLPSLRLFQELIEDISTNESIPIDTVFYRLFANAIEVYGTGSEGWFLIDNYLVTAPSNWSDGVITLQLNLSINDRAMVACPPGVLPYDYETDWPIVKLLISGGESIYNYSFLKDLELESIEIEAAVTGLKSLTLINDAGLLDNTAPFLPFGPIPTKNSYLLIGNVELFTKPITELNLNLEWNNLPDEEGGFTTYFEDYAKPNEAAIANASFTCELSALSNYSFLPTVTKERETLALFSLEEKSNTLSHLTSFCKVDLEKLAIQPDYQIEELLAFDNKIRSGYLRLQLNSPSMLFGHRDYQRIFARTMMANAHLKPGKGEPKDPPREPFAPVLRQITVDYRSSSTLNLKDLESWTNRLDRKEKIFRIHPFGTETIFEKGRAKDQFLLPQFDQDGYLYIGLSHLSAPQPLSLFFHIQDSKAAQSLTPIAIQWRYLANNKWINFTEAQVLADATAGFTTSGIVLLDIPADINLNHSILPAHLHWLSISVSGGLANIGRMIDVQLHAVPVQWVDNGDLAHYDSLENLPRIKELVKPLAEISLVKQVIDFSGLQGPEKLLDLYTRVSERLRHKGRAISAWDIEHLVLSQFPVVQQVKCIGVSNYRAYVNPGTIKVVVIPKAKTGESEPALGFHTLQQIKEYLEKITSPFVQVEVINPVYEKLKIICSVLLRPGLQQEKGFRLQQLHEELLAFLCPWTKEGPVALGGQIAKNDILHFIKDRSYIRFITRFSVVQVYEERQDQFTIKDTARPGETLDTIRASKPWSALVPIVQHQINFLEEDYYEVAEVTAIENMRVGTDFIVLDELEEEETITIVGAKSIQADPEDEWFITI